MKKMLKKCIFIYMLILGLFLLGTAVYAEDAVIQKLQPVPDMPAVAVKVNGDGSEIQEVLDKIEYKGYEASSGWISFSFQWDYSHVKLNMPGAYVVTGIPKIPEGYKLDSSFSLPVFRIGVSVQETNKPDINVFQKITAEKLFVFPWLENKNAGNWQLWMRKEGGEWYDAAKNGQALCNEKGLYLPENVLIAGNTYYMAIRGEDVASRTLKFNYTMDGDIKILSYAFSAVADEGIQKKCISSYDPAFPAVSAADYLRVFPAGVSQVQLQEYVMNIPVSLNVSTEEKFEDAEVDFYIVLSPKWDFSGVDANKSGVYDVIGRFEAPEEYTIKDGLVLPEMKVAVSVQTLRKPELHTYKIVHGTAQFPFLLQGFTNEEVKQMKVFMQVNGEEFTELKEKRYRLEEDFFSFNLSELKAGNRYGIYLTYPGGETKVFSFTYSVDEFKDIQISERNKNDDKNDVPPVDDGSLDDGLVDGDDELEGEDDLLGDEYLDSYGGGYYYGGGGDDSGSSGGDGYSGKISEETEKILEELAANSVSLVNEKRLASMKENQDGSVVFEKDGITLKLPGSFLEKEKVEKADEIQVVLQKTSDSSLSIRVYLNNVEIREIPDATVTVPVRLMDDSLQPEQVQILNVEDQAVEHQYDAAQKAWKISVDHTGDYFLRNLENMVEEEFSDGEEEVFEDVMVEMDEDFSDSELDDESVDAAEIKEETSDEKNVIVEQILSFCKENWIWLSVGALAFAVLFIVCSLFDKKK